MRFITVLRNRFLSRLSRALFESVACRDTLSSCRVVHMSPIFASEYFCALMTCLDWSSGVFFGDLDEPEDGVAELFGSSSIPVGFG